MESAGFLCTVRVAQSSVSTAAALASLGRARHVRTLQLARSWSETHASLARLVSLLPRFDRCVFYRIPLPAWTAAWLGPYRDRLVYDFDDALDQQEAGETHLMARLRGRLWRHSLARAIECCKIIVTSNQRNAAAVQAAGGDAVLIPTCVDIDRYPFPARDGPEGHGFQQASMASLTEADPSVDWATRLLAARPSDPWPYDDQSTDVVLSNQVLEHVRDHHHVFGQLSRVLRVGAFSAHLFPLKHYVYEGYLLIPYAHRISDHDVLRWYIAWASRLGIGKFRAHRREGRVSVEEFSERHADFLYHFTSYLSYRDVIQLAKMHGLRPSFRYTPEFYGRKLRQLFGRPPRWRYNPTPPPWQWLSTTVLKYANCISLFLERQEHYSRR